MLEFKIQQHPNLIVAIAPIRLMGVEQFIDVFEVEIAAPEAAAIFSRYLRQTFDGLMPNRNEGHLIFKEGITWPTAQASSAKVAPRDTFLCNGHSEGQSQHRKNRP